MNRTGTSILRHKVRLPASLSCGELSHRKALAEKRLFPVSPAQGPRGWLINFKRATVRYFTAQPAENLIEDLPARAARENFGKSALAEGPDRH